MKQNTCPNGHQLGAGDNLPVIAANGAFVCDFCVDCHAETGWYWYGEAQHQHYHEAHPDSLFDMSDLLVASVSELRRLGQHLGSMTPAQTRSAKERVLWICDNFDLAQQDLADV